MCIRDSLSNVAQHAGASAVSIAIAFEPDQIAVTIADDGKGLSESDLARARRERRLGLYGMRERVELLQGTFAIRQSPSGGAALCITIPQSRAEKENDHETKAETTAGGRP